MDFSGRFSRTTAAPAHVGESGPVLPKRPSVPHYYERLGLGGHDAILRCHDCGRLVTYQRLMDVGMTPCCGTRRVKQVQHLRVREWLRIRLGLLDFPYRQEFLAEMTPRLPSWWVALRRRFSRV